MADDFRPVDDDRIVDRPAPPPERHRHRRRGRRAMTALIAVAAVLGFGVILVYAYNKGRQDGESRVPPVIQAQQGPTKVRPDSPGGMDVPDRDKEIFSRLEAETQPDRVERLLPPPEKPMERPEPSAMAPASPPEMETAAGRLPEMPLKEAESPQSETPAPAATMTETAKLPTPPAAMPKEPAPPVAAKPPLPAPKPVENKVAAKPEPAPKPAAGDGWKIQLSSLRSEAAAERSWAAVQKKNGDLLGGLTSSVQKITLAGGKGTYYRLQAGPVASRAAANELCTKLKARKQGCIVVRP